MHFFFIFRIILSNFLKFMLLLATEVHILTDSMKQDQDKGNNVN